MATYQDVLTAARTLSGEEKARLADALWEEVDREDSPPLSDEWMAEIQRRSDELDAGRAATTPWPEVKAWARRKAGLDA